MLLTFLPLYNTELTTTRNSRWVGISKSKAESLTLSSNPVYIWYSIIISDDIQICNIFYWKTWAQHWRCIFFLLKTLKKQGGRCRILHTDSFPKSKSWFTTAFQYQKFKILGCVSLLRIKVKPFKWTALTKWFKKCKSK